MENSRWSHARDNLHDYEIEDDDELILDSPEKQPLKSGTNTHQPPKTPSNPTHQSRQKSQDTSKRPANGVEDNERDAALRVELESLRRINQVIEGVTASLEKAKSNMDTINATVTNAHQLLDTWTRILSQTEHNQRLILNPAWHGASADLAEAENETLTRQRERERREMEEAERRAAAEEEKLRLEERRRVEMEKREASAGARSSRPGSRVGVGASRGRGGVTRAGRITPAAGTGSANSSVVGGKAPITAGVGAGRGRGAVAGYGRIGSVGTKAARGRGRGTT